MGEREREREGAAGCFAGETQENLVRLRQDFPDSCCCCCFRRCCLAPRETLQLTRLSHRQLFKTVGVKWLTSVSGIAAGQTEWLQHFHWAKFERNSTRVEMFPKKRSTATRMTQQTLNLKRQPVWPLAVVCQFEQRIVWDQLEKACILTAKTSNLATLFRQQQKLSLF